MKLEITDMARTLPILVGAVAVLSLLYGLGLAIYRLYFHPLKNFPGPKLLAISGLPYGINNNLRGIWHKDMLKAHEKYGPIVRVGPNHLAVDGSIGWPEVYGHKRAARQEFGRVHEFQDPGKEGRQSIFIANREDHRRHRRLMAHAFSDAAMYEQEPLITTYVDLFITRLKEVSVGRQPLDIVRWFNYTTFDIIGDLAFADPFDCLSTSDMHPWVAMIFSGIKAGSILRFLVQYPAVALLINLVYGKQMEKNRKQHRALTVEKTKRRLDLGKTPNGRSDFLTYLLRHNDEKGMSEKEIIDNCEALIIAGSETTATALSGLTYYLTQNPQVWERLTGEIRSTFASEDEITMRSTAPLTYLHACLEEGLRRYPPVVESPPRRSPGDYVHGKYIPEGTPVTIHQWASHHSSRNFIDPFAFKPERFLPPTHPYYEQKFSNDNKVAFSPFSAGPRNCIGRNLAYSELRLILTRLLWNFDVSLVEGYEKWPEEHKAYIIWEKTPLMVRLTPVVRE